MTLADVVKHHLEVKTHNDGFNWEVRLVGMVVWSARGTREQGLRDASMFRAELAARLLAADS